MSRSTLRASARRRTALVAIPAGLAIALAGCSAGQITQTSTQRSSVDGIDYKQGDIQILDASIEAPSPSGWAEGETAGLELTVVNSAMAADEITAIEIDGNPVTLTPAAGTAEEDNSTNEDAASDAQATASSEAGDAGSTDAPSSESASESAPAEGGDAAPSSAPQAAESAPLTVGAQDKAVINPEGDAQATFEIPKGPLYTSETLPITITFRDAGELSFNIVVGGNLTEDERDPSSKADLHEQPGGEGEGEGGE